jgi:hypothetical protein
VRDDGFGIASMRCARFDTGRPGRPRPRSDPLASASGAGLAIEEWAHFSFVQPKKTKWFSDELQIPQEFLREMGISQYAIVKRGNLPVRTSGG